VRSTEKFEGHGFEARHERPEENAKNDTLHSGSDSALWGKNSEKKYFCQFLHKNNSLNAFFLPEAKKFLEYARDTAASLKSLKN
jgi:hypothetical protein